MSMCPAHPRRLWPRRLWAAAAVLLVLSACEDVSVTAVEVTSVAVAPSQGILLPGDTLRLAGTAYSASGSPLEGRSVDWTSENGSVATVSSSGLVEAHSVGQATIRASSGGASGTGTVTVQPRPEIVLSASELSFGGTQGGDPTDPVQLQVTNGGGGTLSGLSLEVAYASGQPTGWLEASLQGSQAPAALSARARPGILPSGRYEAEIRVRSAQAANSPQGVSVSFEVGAPSPAIQLSTSATGFVWEEGQPAPSAQVVQIANSGGGQLEGLAISVRYPTGQATGWLTAQLNRTNAPAELTLRASPGGLSQGTFDAFVDVSADGAPNSPQELRVRLTVGAPPPELELDPESLQWAIVEGGEGDPPARTVTVENRGSGTLGGLSASVTHPQGQPTGWLNVSLAGGTAPTSLTVGLAAQSLPPGNYQGTVAVASADAVNSPRSVTVALQVTPGADAELSEILADPETVVADGVSTSAITVVLRDAQGAPLSSGGHQVALSTTRGTLGSVTDQGDGTYTATFTAPTGVGTALITGTVDGEAIGGSATIVLAPGSISTEASDVEASTASGVPADGEAAATVMVGLRDASGNPIGGVASGDFAVDVSGSGSAGTVTETNTTGTYRFSVTNTVAETVTVTVSALGVTLADRPSITFVAETPPATRLAFGVQPSDTQAGATISPAVTVRVEDDDGNLVESASTSVTLAIDDNPSDGTLSGTTTRSAVNGIATFDDLSIDRAGDGYTLEASAAGFSDIESQAFDIIGVSGDRVVFAVQPSDTQAGATMSPGVTLRLEDERGNLIRNSRPLTVSIANNPGNGTLSGTTTRNAVNGIATFDDLSIDRAGDGYTLEASGPGVSRTTSRAFDITASDVALRPSALSQSLGHDALRGAGWSRVDHTTTLEVVDHSRREDGVDHVGEGEWLAVFGVADVVDLNRSPVHHDDRSGAEDGGSPFVLDQETRVFLETESQHGWVRGDRVHQSGDS